VLLGLVAGAAAVGTAQAPGETPGSLAALTAEVRQLRQAVEDSTRTQSQMQAVGVYLSAQQSRMVQLSQQLDALRRDLPAAAVRRQQTAALATAAQAELAEPMPPAELAGRRQMFQSFKEHADLAAQHEQQLQQRQSALLQMLQQDEARWADLIAKLETVIRR
jgi:hypothetical protein